MATQKQNSLQTPNDEKQVMRGSATWGNPIVDYETGATYSTLQHWFNTTQSPGLISGGTVTDNGDGTVAVTAGTGIIKITDSEIATTRFFDFAQDTSVSLVDDSLNYVYVDYNAGSPIIDSTTDWATLDLTTQFPIALVFRDGTDAEIVDCGMNLPNYMINNSARLYHRGIEHMSGGIVAETGERYLTTTDGVYFLAHKEVNTTAIDTSGSGRFTSYYRDSGSGTGWTSVPNQQQIDNTQYDDGDGLSTLTANRYAVHWVYVCMEGSLYTVYGQGDYTLANALASVEPSSLPNYLSDFAILAAIGHWWSYR